MLPFPEPRTLFALLSRAATAPGGTAGIRFVARGAEERLTYVQLLERTLARASTLEARGRGDQCILLVLGNGVDVVELLFAALSLGRVAAILPPLPPFGDVEVFAQRLARTAAKADHALVVTTPVLARVLRGSVAGAALDLVTTEELAPGARREPTPTSGRATALMQMTSGSLSHPKGVRLSHDALLADALAIAGRLGITPTDVGCAWVPLAHDMALISLLMVLSAGAEHILMTTESFAADPGGWLSLCHQHGVSVTVGPPYAFATAAQRLQRSKRTPDLSGLRAAVVGAEPISATLLRGVHQTLAPLGLREPLFVPAYGLAEDTCVATMGTPGTAFPTRAFRAPLVPFQSAGESRPDDPRALLLVGHGPVLSEQSLRIVDGDGEPLPDGHVGLVEIGGAARMTGYHGDPEQTALAFHGEWLRTFDYGVLVDGFLYVAGRAKDVIVLRGRNVLPEEIEAVALELEGLFGRGAVAFGTVDATGGPEQITLVVEASGDADAAGLERALQRHIADRLDVRVDRVVFVGRGEIPRTTSGKPKRGVARERWSAC